MAKPKAIAVPMAHIDRTTQHRTADGCLHFDVELTAPGNFDMYLGAEIGDARIVDGKLMLHVFLVPK